jgi:hypothetical protein
MVNVMNWIVLSLLVISTIQLTCEAHPQRVMVIHNKNAGGDSGGDYHVYITLKALITLGYNVTFCYPHNVDKQQQIHAAATKFKVYKKDRLQDELKITVLDTPYLLQHIHHSGENKYIAVFEFIWMSPDYIMQLRRINELIKDYSPSTKIVVINPDAIHLRLRRELEASGGKQQNCTACERYKAIETYFWRNADIVAGVSDEVNQVTRAICPHCVLTRSPYCQPNLLSDRGADWIERSGVVYFGTRIPANMKSSFFLQEFLPPKLYPATDALLHIYGKVSGKNCKENKGCKYHGAVSTEELNNAIMHSRWMVAPIFSGNNDHYALVYIHADNMYVH